MKENLLATRLSENDLKYLKGGKKKNKKKVKDKSTGGIPPTC